MAAGLDSQKRVRLFREAVADSPKAMSQRHSQVGTAGPTSKLPTMMVETEFAAPAAERSSG
jgi:hypothetical protein